MLDKSGEMVMKKRVMLIVLLWGVIILGMTGCGKKNKSVDIKITLNTDTTTVNVQVGKVLTYSLLGQNYEFKITDISEDKISMEVNKYGLTDTDDLRTQDNKFTIEKGKKLELYTQTTDYQEKIIFEY